MKLLKTFSGLIIFLFYSFTCYSQKQTLSISDNGEFIAIADKSELINDTIFVKDGFDYKLSYKELHDTKIYLYYNNTGEFIKTIHLKTDEITNIKYADFSKNYNTFYLKNNNNFIFWNIPSGKIFKNIKADTVVVSNQYDAFFALVDNKIVKYSFFYNTTDTFQIKAKKQITKIGISSDDKFLIANGSDKKVYIWQLENQNSDYKSIFAIDFAASEDNSFYLSNLKSNVISVVAYDSEINDEEFERGSTIKSTRYIKSGKIVKTKLQEDISQFSPDGNFYIFSAKKGRKKNITFVNLTTRKSTLQIKQKKKNYKILSPYFYSDSICFIQKNEKTIEIYDIYKGKKLETFTSDNQISPEEIVFDKQALHFEQSSNNILISNNKNKQIEFENSNSLIFSRNNNKNILLENSDNQIVYYSINNFFSDTVRNFFEEPKEEISESFFNKFDNIQIDTASYIYLNEIKNISKSKNTNLSIKVKAIEIKEDYTALQFYLLDEENNFYYGASAEEWKEIFCKVTLENNKGEKQESENYKILEMSDKDNKSIALSFVLDHSGSVSSETAKLMQENVLTIAKTKNKADGVSLIKFDDKVNREIELTKNSTSIQNELKINGTEGYGGSTALLDGINEGLDLLIENQDFEQKALIVLTDGYENASKSTQNEVFMKAINNRINIYTIGYGSSVDVEFLRTIAENTNGGYYWISDNNNLKDIFKDIYKNIKNYYSLRFNTPYPGEYQISLELCTENNHDSVSYLFNNYIPDLIFTNDKQEQDSLFQVLTGIGDTIYFDDFNSHRIYEDIEFLYLKEEFDSLIFPNIKFDFNKVSIVKDTDKELVNVINFMEKYPNTRIEIQGHTDNKGGLLYNEVLSQKRSEKVKSIMVTQGIAEDRIRTIGYGETKPIATNETDEGRQLNRRVDFLLVK